MKIMFKNGSEIESIDAEQNVRSIRSKYIIYGKESLFYKILRILKIQMAKFQRFIRLKK